MRVYGYPTAPVVVGLILGPLAERQLRHALAIAQGFWTTPVQNPNAAVLLVLAATAPLPPVILRATDRGIVLSAVASDED